MADGLVIPGMGNIRAGMDGPRFGMYQPFVDGFSAVGMTTPITRFAGTTVVVGTALYVFKPAMMFDHNGNARTWYLWSDGTTDSVVIPWWLAAMLGGAFTALFF